MNRFDFSTRTTPRRFALLFAAIASAVIASAPVARAADSRDQQLTDASREPKTVKRGKKLYAQLCLSCHGDERVTTDTPSNLFDAKWHHGARPAEIEATIARGVLDKGMPAWKDALPAEDVAAVTAYLVSFQK